MTRIQHAARLALLMALAAALLGWLARHTEICFADGLRYIDQAQRIERGALAEGLFRAVDHPAYPLAIAGVHAILGGESPDAWQVAAQVAAILAGVLLVVPLYLVALEVFGDRGAWLAVVLAYAVPLTGHVLADTLSESTFLLFWTWGTWTALKFLRRGAFGWLPPTIGFSALAYLSRPEGLLLPAALVGALALMPLLRSTRLNWPRWWAAVGFLVIGPGLLIGPYVAMKGGLGTKPAIQRLLGTAPKSPADAVERQRPLDPGQSTAKTYALAARAMLGAVRESATTPVLILAVVGLALAWPPGERSRAWLFLAVIAGAAALALIRLHATGGYCSPRHAMVLALLLFPAAAYALDRLIGSIVIPGRWVGLEEGRYSAGPAVWALVLAGLMVRYAPSTFAPINAEFQGYREAGRWLHAEQAAPGSPVVDVTGWALYYGQRHGYTFANVGYASGDPGIRWVVVREQHLHGPWTYCKQIQALVGDLRPIKTFPEHPGPRQSKVLVFDRAELVQQAAGGTKAERR